MSTVAPVSGLFVQRVLSPVDAVESWTVLGGDGAPVAPIERYLAYRTQIERSPNTVKAYAHDLKDWFEFLGTQDLDWREARLENVAEFVAWLRRPPELRDGTVPILPSVRHHCTEATTAKAGRSPSRSSRRKRKSHVPGSTPSPTSAPRSDDSATSSKEPAVHRCPRRNVPLMRPYDAASKLPTLASATSPPRTSNSGNNWNTPSGNYGHRTRHSDEAEPLDGRLKISASTRKTSDPLSLVLDVMTTSDQTLDNDRLRRDARIGRLTTRGMVATCKHTLSGDLSTLARMPPARASESHPDRQLPVPYRHTTKTGESNSRGLAGCSRSRLETSRYRFPMSDRRQFQVLLRSLSSMST